MRDKTGIRLDRHSRQGPARTPAHCTTPLKSAGGVPAQWIRTNRHPGSGNTRTQEGIHRSQHHRRDYILCAAHHPHSRTRPGPHNVVGQRHIGRDHDNSQRHTGDLDRNHHQGHRTHTVDIAAWATVAMSHRYSSHHRAPGTSAPPNNHPRTCYNRQKKAGHMMYRSAKAD